MSELHVIAYNASQYISVLYPELLTYILSNFFSKNILSCKIVTYITSSVHKDTYRDLDLVICY